MNNFIQKYQEKIKNILNDKGKNIISAILQYQNITLDQLNRLVA